MQQLNPRFGDLTDPPGLSLLPAGAPRRPHQWARADREPSGQRQDKASPAPPRSKALPELEMNWDLQAPLWKLNIQQPSPPQELQNVSCFKGNVPNTHRHARAQAPTPKSTAGSAPSASHHGDVAGRFHPPGCERVEQAPGALPGEGRAQRRLSIFLCRPGRDHRWSMAGSWP